MSADGTHHQSALWGYRVFAWLNRLSPIIVLAAAPAFEGQALSEEATITAMVVVAAIDALVLQSVRLLDRRARWVLVGTLLACVPLAASLLEYYWLDSANLRDWMDLGKNLIFIASLVCAFVVEATIAATLTAQREAAPDESWRYLADKRLLSGNSYPRLASAQFFERRALQMRSRSLVILSLIVVLIVGGVASIFFAGNIVSNENKGASQLEKVTLIIVDYENKLEELSATIAKQAGELGSVVESLERLGFGIDPTSFAVTKKPTSLTASQTTQATDLLTSLGSLRTGKEQNSSRLADLKTVLAKLEGDLQTNLKAYTTDITANTTDVSLLVASAVTRFGVLFVVIFLVQILLGVYRYSMRLATFYHSRADGLLLAPASSTDLGAWGDQLLPAAVDFGKMPVAPSEYWVTMWRDFVNGMRGTDKKQEEADEIVIPEAQAEKKNDTDQAKQDKIAAVQTIT